MGDVYIPAFGAEAEWRGAGAATLSPVALPRPNGDDDLDEAMALACDKDDFFALRSLPCERIGECFTCAGLAWRPVLSAPAETLRGIPFAITPRSVQFCGDLRLTLAAPGLEVAREVNSKVWSAVAREKAGAPLGSVAFSSTEAFAQAAALLERGPVILKEAFGVSGAGNVVVTSHARLRAIARVLRTEERCGRRVEVVVEPFLQKYADFSSQLELGSDGRWEFLGFQSILNRGSRYLGSRRVSEQNLASLNASDLMETLDSVARQLAEAGYYGPACVDGMILSDGSVTPILEVNARMSMGLLNLLLTHKISKWDLTSTLLKVRVCFRAAAPCPLDLLAREALLPRRPGEPAVLPITSSVSATKRGTWEIIAALLYRTARQETLLWSALLAAFAAARVETNLPHL
jgi:hypothetical protein